jgi:hypothetical protein
VTVGSLLFVPIGCPPAQISPARSIHGGGKNK